MHCFVLAAGPTDAAYNVMLSTNHPKFVAMYAQEVLPKLAQLQQQDYPDTRMLPCLKDYLRFHQKRIEEVGYWHVAKIILAL